MQLAILKNATVGVTQDAFHAEFPYLKIAFFSRSHREHGSNSARQMIGDRNQLLADLPGFRSEGLLAIEPHMRTWEVEKMIEENTGLHVQLFRKSGNTWLETSVSDHLSLEEQSERARAQEEYRQPFVDPMDYREQD
jgi:hypothetical protein